MAVENGDPFPHPASDTRSTPPSEYATPRGRRAGATVRYAAWSAALLTSPDGVGGLPRRSAGHLRCRAGQPPAQPIPAGWPKAYAQARRIPTGQVILDLGRPTFPRTYERELAAPLRQALRVRRLVAPARRARRRRSTSSACAAVPLRIAARGRTGGEAPGSPGRRPPARRGGRRVELALLLHSYELLGPFPNPSSARRPTAVGAGQAWAAVGHAPGCLTKPPCGA